MERNWAQITPRLAADLTRALFCGLRSMEKRVAVLTAFSDESGSGDDRGSFVVGGCVADVDSWSYFSTAWQERVLDARPSIPYLHMVEIRRKAFKLKYGLSDLQAEDKVRTASKIIDATGGLSNIVSHVNQADLRDVLQGRLLAQNVRLRIGVDQPDYMCFMGYAYLTLQHVRAECPTAEKVDFVVSRKGKITDHIKFFHEELRKFAEAHDPTLAELVGTLIPADMEDRVPLQAADVFCWHIRRRYEEGTERKYKCRSARWTKEDLEALAANLLTL